MKIARTVLAVALLAYLVGNEERITLAQDFCNTQEILCAAECDTPVTFTGNADRPSRNRCTRHTIKPTRSTSATGLF